MNNNNNNNERYLSNINTNEHYYKLVTKEANRLLLDFDYLKKPTDEDLELAYMISYVLQDMVGIQNGCSLTELTVSLLYSENDKRGLPKDGDDKFFEEEHYKANEKKVVRAIDLVKRMSLEALVKEFEAAASNDAKKEEQTNKIIKLSFYVCSAYSKEHDSVLYFNFLGRDKNNVEERLSLLNQFYKFLGFADAPKDDYCITPKGLGIVRFNKSADNVVNSSGNDNSENTYDYDMTDEEIDDILANVQGNYTSEIGLTELTNLAVGCLSLMEERTSAENGISEEELMHALIPESTNASSSELAMYRTKIKDALYFINRMYYPSPKYDKRLSRQQRRANERLRKKYDRFGK